MAEIHQVPSLKSLTTTCIVQKCWRSSGAETLLARKLFTLTNPHNPACNNTHFYDVAHRNKLQSTSLKRHFHEIRKHMTLFDMPAHLKLDIINAFQAFEADAIEFGRFVVDSLGSHVTPRLAEICIRSFVLTPRGTIDKPETFIKMALSVSRLVPNICSKYTSYYCVSLERARSLLREQQRDGSILNTIFSSQSFQGPSEFWLQLLHRSGVEISLFECCTVKGPLEAMEYFLPSLEPEHKQSELSRAAVHMLHCKSFDTKKLLFFYKHMEPAAWRVLLKRYFNRIMVKLINSPAHRYLSVHLYRQVSDSISGMKILRVLRHITSGFLTDLDPLPLENQLNDLLLSDFEHLFLAFWHSIPNISDRIQVVVKVPKLLNRFLNRNRFHVVASIIENDTLDTYTQHELIYHVMMTLIVTRKREFIKKFLDALSPHFDRETIMKNYLSFDCFCCFIVHGDRCAHVSNYNMLLRTKYDNQEIKDIKKRVLNHEIYSWIASEKNVKNTFFYIKVFYCLLLWCFSYDTMLLRQFLTDSARNLDIMATVYMHNIISRRTSIYTWNPLSLTDKEMQPIYQELSTEKRRRFLMMYCADLLKLRQYDALPQMLSNVFTDDASRKEFVTSFILSDYFEPEKSLFTLRMFDEHLYFYNSHMENCVEQYIQFKKHWILTEEIGEVVKRRLDNFVLPTVNVANLRANLLPHESYENFRVINEENRETLHALLTRTEDGFYKYLYGDDDDD